MIDYHFFETPFILRITIDEVMEGELIRALMSTIKYRAEVISLSDEKWSQEKEVLVDSTDYAKYFNMTISKQKKYPWKSLREGHVFLSGKFKVHRKNSFKNIFITSSKRKNFLRVDQSLKRDLKIRYLMALSGGDYNAKTN